jgi:hypothetical protein
VTGTRAETAGALRKTDVELRLELLDRPVSVSADPHKMSRVFVFPVFLPVAASSP